VIELEPAKTGRGSNKFVSLLFPVFTFAGAGGLPAEVEEADNAGFERRFLS